MQAQFEAGKHTDVVIRARVRNDDVNEPPQPPQVSPPQPPATKSRR